MVATRRSLPHPTALPLTSTTPTTPLDAKAKKALDKLNIDGLGGLIGDKSDRKEEENVEVYYWRGAAYAVTEDTKEEWVEGQPDRYKKRKRVTEGEGDEESNAKRMKVGGAESEAVKAKETGEVGTDMNETAENEDGHNGGVKLASTTAKTTGSSAAPEKMKKKSSGVGRKVSYLSSVTVGPEEAKQIAKKKTTKRARPDEDDADETEQQSPPSSIDTPTQPTSEPPQQKPSSSTLRAPSPEEIFLASSSPVAPTTRPPRPKPDYSYFGQPAKKKRRAPFGTKKRSKPAAAAPPPEEDESDSIDFNDYARAGGHQTFSCVQAQRRIESQQRAAVAAGYTVLAFEESSQLPNPCVAILEERRLKKEAERKVKELTVEIFKHNARVAELYGDYEGVVLKTGLDGLLRIVGPLPPPKAFVAQATAPSPPTTQPPATQIKHSTAAAPPLNDETPLTSSSPLRSTDSTPPTSSGSARHDSAASLTSEVEIITSPRPAPAPVLEKTNKAGHTLRWSIGPALAAGGGGGGGLSGQCAGGAAGEGLESVLGDRQRAENAIKTGRLEGESHSARRRRVRREKAVLEGWRAEQGSPR